MILGQLRMGARQTKNAPLNLNHYDDGDDLARIPSTLFCACLIIYFGLIMIMMTRMMMVMMITIRTMMMMVMIKPEFLRHCFAPIPVSLYTLRDNEHGHSISGVCIQG